MRSETSPMSKTGIEKSVRLLWVVGNCLCCFILPLLWWQGYEAQTAAHASLNITRLGIVSSIGILWAVAGAAWLANRKKRKA